MENQDQQALTGPVIVIGASAGGFDVLKTIVAGLPNGFGAPVLIVWHMSATTTGILPHVLNKVSRITASNAYDRQPLLPGHIYVAPPDRHLLIDGGVLRVTRGPKENRFRPAVDPLFRSAANSWGQRVIGVILSGALDDGASGLWSIKQAGGIAIVQDPADADVSAMPENAMRAVQVDYCLPAGRIAELLVKLASRSYPLTSSHMNSPDKTRKEIAIATESAEAALEIFSQGSLSALTCPECGGVLARFLEDDRPRFRCHTGHAYSTDVLLAAITGQIEDDLYGAIRRVDESAMLLNHLGDHFAEINQPKLAAVYFRKAQEAMARARAVRQALKGHEQLSLQALRDDAGPENETGKDDKP